jgi:hypothetical protein
MEPRNGLAVVRQGLNRFSMQDNPVQDIPVEDASAARLAADPLQIDHLHPVYHLVLGPDGGERNLDVAVLTGFRYLVREAAGELSFVEIRVDAAHNATRMTMRGYGRYAEAIIAGMAKVEKLPAVATGSYELRVLHCSAIYLVALWLKGDQGAPDILYPLAPAPPGFQAERSYSADEFLNLARSLAQARAAAHAGL